MKSKVRRPISYETIKVCEYLETHGPAPTEKIARLLRATANNAGKRMKVAVRCGLITKNFERIPYLYSAAPGWREIVQKCANVEIEKQGDDEMSVIKKKTLETCAVLESAGPMSAMEAAAALGSSRDAARLRLESAIRCGLATIDRSGYPYRTSVVPGWRDIAAEKTKIAMPTVKAPSADWVEYVARPRMGNMAGTPWQGLDLMGSRA